MNRYRVHVIQMPTILSVDSINLDANDADDAALQIARRWHTRYPNHLYAVYAKVDGRTQMQRFAYDPRTDAVSVA